MKNRLLLCMSLGLTGCHLVQAAEPAETREADEPSSPEQPDLSEMPLSEALEAKQEELEKKEAELAEAQADLEAARKELEARLSELDDKLERLENARDGVRSKKEQEDVERLLQLVQTAEKMKPEPAARYLDEFDLETATNILHGMKIRKAAEVISKMNPSRAAKMSRHFLTNGHPSPPSERNKKR